jgi:uroporphyrin-III C-methyltransferase
VTVHLVGAGPGDPDLLTVRAVNLIRQADVVVHDRLVDPAVVDLAPPWAERINVGKAPGAPSPSQGEINAILIDRGRRFEHVVRLKGGDPFVFGRGGEEASALRAAGVAVEVAPGVTSAVAAPAAAGIPVTLRGVSSGFTVVTAHQDPSSDRWLNWDALAQAGTTLVILMGAARTTQIADRLRAGGMASDTPVAVISAATTARQQIDRTDLSGLRRLRAAGPATIVVGAVAAADVLALSELNASGALTSLGAVP